MTIQFGNIEVAGRLGKSNINRHGQIKNQAEDSRVRSQASVTHAYNPSYSGGREEENRGSEASLDKMKARPYFKNTQHTKKGLVEWLKWSTA
jgi:hypothetical protein